MTTVRMRAPTAFISGFIQTIGFVPSGTAYTTDANGTILAQAQDVPTLTQLGFVTVGTGTANGLVAAQQRFTDFRNIDASYLATTASAGKFGLASTVGANLNLASEAAQGNTKTDNALYEYVLPQAYIAGQNITVTANAALSGSGTAGTTTLGLTAYRMSTADVAGSNICPTAAQAIAAASGDLVFTITGATLNPGDKIVFQLTAIVQETGGTSSLSATVNSLRIS